MDTSITFATPEYWRERGAEAYDLGLSQDDHDMNPGSAAIRDWQAGWHQRRVERSRAAGNQARMAVAA